MMIATLTNWDNANRLAGKSCIRIHDDHGQTAGSIVRVAKGQSARDALEASGWATLNGTWHAASPSVAVTRTALTGVDTSR
jgi:hypothetical protein